ncbi:MAG: hypothetical protein OEP52_13355, partial [Acidimicrobiia bacterium]|nr:hypothetical protein [Acidimicrobiia bacterium]
DPVALHRDAHPLRTPPDVGNRRNDLLDRLTDDLLAADDRGCFLPPSPPPPVDIRTQRLEAPGESLAEAQKHRRCPP